MAQPFSAERPVAWRFSRSDLSRFVTDLIVDEVAHLRPAATLLPSLPWAPELAFDEQGLGLDSLERLAVASALNEALHLHESGCEDLLLARQTFGEWLDVAASGLAKFSSRLTFRTSGSGG